MRRDEDEAGVLRPLELRMGVALAHGGSQGVDARVAGDPDLRLRLALAEQVLLAGLRGGEVVLADDVHGLAVELLRPGAVDVMCAQAGLDVAHRDLQVEARERSGEAGGGVAVDQDHVGPLVLEDGLELDQHVARHVEQRLARLHNRQVVVGSHVEDAQHLVEHLTMLAGHGHEGLELIRPRLQLVGERAHLDCLWAGAEDEHYLLIRHFRPPYSRSYSLGTPPALPPSRACGSPRPRAWTGRARSGPGAGRWGPRRSRSSRRSKPARPCRRCRWRPRRRRGRCRPRT